MNDAACNEGSVILIQYYYVGRRDVPRVTSKGQVTIPKEIRETLGIEAGDEVTFVEGDTGYEIRKQKPTTAGGEDPFEKYRGSGQSDETMPQRMQRLRGEYPRDSSGLSESVEDERRLTEDDNRPAEDASSSGDET